eukprot:gnl/MRDRNA2_/MRDRNA2_16463_c0_seq1.p1 gnl/MRDRNA2_/MRDRNA2_16463_c0~~gnl/MRDRNA2_/MRDRNA2_16463_c0_seq1.p1  ORF type:complete len:513 (+),score=60.47 gnl/MRDRNA2_/MRDRNA2_16463_c0_seq1:158-1696(+)
MTSSVPVFDNVSVARADEFHWEAGAEAASKDITQYVGRQRCELLQTEEGAGSRMDQRAITIDTNVYGHVSPRGRSVSPDVAKLKLTWPESVPTCRSQSLPPVQLRWTTLSGDNPRFTALELAIRTDRFHPLLRHSTAKDLGNSSYPVWNPNHHVGKSALTECSAVSALNSSSLCTRPAKATSDTSSVEPQALQDEDGSHRELQKLRERFEKIGSMATLTLHDANLQPTALHHTEVLSIQSSGHDISVEHSTQSTPVTSAVSPCTVASFDSSVSALTISDSRNLIGYSKQDGSDQESLGSASTISTQVPSKTSTRRSSRRSSGVTADDVDENACNVPSLSITLTESSEDGTPNASRAGSKRASVVSADEIVESEVAITVSKIGAASYPHAWKQIATKGLNQTAHQFNKKVSTSRPHPAQPQKQNIKVPKDVASALPRRLGLPNKIRSRYQPPQRRLGCASEYAQGHAHLGPDNAEWSKTKDLTKATKQVSAQRKAFEHETVDLSDDADKMAGA